MCQKVSSISLNLSLNSFFGGRKGDNVRKICCIGWDECKDRHCGGLGIKNLEAFNLALLGKWVWRFRVEKDMLWRRVLAARDGELGEESGVSGYKEV